MGQRPERVKTIVLAACTLHNMLRTLYPRSTTHLVDREDRTNGTIRNGAWRDVKALDALQQLRGNQGTQAAKAVRTYLCQYYNHHPSGIVPWQERMI